MLFLIMLQLWYIVAMLLGCKTRMNAKPFVKWVGGKRQLLSQFRELGLYPSNFDGANHRYFEPFVGGGAVFFDLQPKNATISDLNSELITTYLVIRDNVEPLVESLKKHIYDKDYFLKIRAMNPTEMSELDVASRLIYLNRTCFNGMYRVNSKGQFNVPFGRYKNPIICDGDNLRAASRALNGVEILNANYKVAVSKAKVGDFVYFDPPYYPVSSTSSFTSYTKDGFAEKEQIELRDTFAELSDRGCYVMLSNSDTTFIRNIYSGLKNVTITTVSAGRAINSKATARGKITELVITSYPVGGNDGGKV